MTPSPQFIPSVALLNDVLALKVLDLSDALSQQTAWVPMESLSMPDPGVLRTTADHPPYALSRAEKQLEYTATVAKETFENVMGSLKAKIVLHKLQHGHKDTPPPFQLGLGRVDDGGVFIFFMTGLTRHLQFIGPAAQLWRLDFADLEAVLPSALKNEVVLNKKRIIQAVLNHFYMDLIKMPLVQVVSWFSNSNPGNPIEIATGVDRAVALMTTRAAEIGDLQERLLAEYRMHCDLHQGSRIRDLTTTQLMQQLDERLTLQRGHLSIATHMARMEAAGGLSVLKAAQFPLMHQEH